MPAAGARGDDERRRQPQVAEHEPDQPAGQRDHEAPDRVQDQVHGGDTETVDGRSVVPARRSRAGPRGARRMRRCRRACARGRSTSSSGRSTCWARAARCAPRSSRGGRSRWSSTGRPARARRRSRGSSPRRPTRRSRSSARSTPARPRCAASSTARPSAAAAGAPTIFFLDEIHRFNKAQQDALLPAVEDGLVTLIGATTENPYFEVNSALLCRAQVIELDALAPADVAVLLRRASTAASAATTRCPTRSSSSWPSRTGGDARAALTALEVACETRRGEITMDVAEDALRRRAVRYDKAGDQHYDYISALIKSVRGSDPDAAHVLPRGDARGRRGPALPRAAHDRAGVGGHRQRRPARAARSRSPRRRPSSTSACPSAASRSPSARCTSRSRRSRTPRCGPSAPPARHVREHGAQLPPDALRSAAYPARTRARPRPGLRLPARPPGEGLAAGAAARQRRPGERFVELDATEPELRDRLQRIREARHR